MTSRREFLKLLGVAALLPVVAAKKLAAAPVFRSLTKRWKLSPDAMTQFESLLREQLTPPMIDMLEFEDPIYKVIRRPKKV